VRLTARVPATVANLGPGFDSFGLALALHNEITLDTDADPSITIEGEGEGELPTDESNLVIRAMRTLEAAAGMPLPPFAASCTNRIPLERGLGSSAGAVVGGLLLANHLLDSWVRWDELLRLAVELEGHADNVGAALRGNATITYYAQDRWWVHLLHPPDELRPVVLIPRGERVNTEEARRALPPHVDRSDAIFNASRAALLSLALTSDPVLLVTALEDRLHQEARLGLAPAARELFSRLRDSGIPVCVAGSAPTLLAFEVGDRPVPDPGDGWRILRPEIDREGANVLEAGPVGR